MIGEKWLKNLFDRPFFYGNLQFFVCPKMKELIAKEINKDLKENNKFLDVGCGIGEMCLFIQAKYTGIDNSKLYINSAKKDFPTDNFEYGNCLNLPFKNKSFNSSLVLGVLHHLNNKNAQKTLLEMNRVTKKNIYIVESIGTKGFIGNFLRTHDRGAYIRSLSDNLKIASKHFTIKKTKQINTGFYKLIFIELEAEKSE